MLIKAPNTKVRLATTGGHVLWLGPDEERELEGDLLQLAYEKGCTRQGAPSAQVLPVADDDAEADERKELLESAIRELMERGDPSAFTGSGMPRVREVAVIFGDEVTKAEVDAVFLGMED